MEIVTNRISETVNWTISDLTIDGKHICYTLQDGAVGGGVNGKGRIPAGRYKVVFHPRSSKQAEYMKRFGTSHRHGMLLLEKVPNYAGILIHMGVRPEHTLGCILVGMKADWIAGELSKSKEAYAEVYRIISGAILLGETVYITVRY